MIHFAAVSISRLWVRNSMIPDTDAEAYQYGLELLFSTILNIAVMIGLSIALGQLRLFVPYLIAFIPLRIFAGGYHAKHHFSCILLNALVYFASLIAVNTLSMSAANLACILESCFSFAVIFHFAPVPAKNKPLSAKEQKKNRRISLALGFLLLVLCTIFYITHFLSFNWCQMMYCGQFAVTILLISGKAVTTIENLHK